MIQNELRLVMAGLFGKGQRTDLIISMMAVWAVDPCKESSVRCDESEMVIKQLWSSTDESCRVS